MDKISKNYSQMAMEFLELQKPEDVTVDFQQSVFRFSKYLDSFPSLTSDLELMVLHKARQIDHEVLLAIANIVGKEKFEEVLRSVVARHKHTKVNPNKDDTSQSIPA